MGDIAEEVRRLLSQSVASGTRAAYQSSVEAFQRFRISCAMDTSWPATTKQVMAFVAHLSLSGNAPSTIAVRVSAISFLHNMYCWVDPTQHFLIRKMIEGCRRSKGGKDSRKPITLTILNRIIPNLGRVCTSNYETCLFKAAFLLAFFWFFTCR